MVQTTTSPHHPLLAGHQCLAVGQPGGHAMFGIMELIRVALERCATARCAVRTMGDLAVEHGFYGDGTGTPGQRHSE